MSADGIPDVKMSADGIPNVKMSADGIPDVKMSRATRLSGATPSRFPKMTCGALPYPDSLREKHTALDFKASLLHVSELSIALPWIPKNSLQSQIALLQAERDIGRIDKSVLWNKAREKKGKFNKIIEPMINMIDELLEKAKETGLPPPSPNDIFCQALGKLDHPGRVVGCNKCCTQLDARLPFPNPYEIINVGDAIGFELDWLTSLVILETEHPQVLDKEKKKMVNAPII
ncbi:hypothetical protein CK203_017907 [Vitis vinifera]|uniref:Uncharacterized protein n=1 Tax=Vitis vinifera TaxID=29760 RepID=A0A438JVW2_VITVI|nr:hypothetical protein CK203_017907 [Vitis vinifera]